jgi:hypothetical protein
MCGLLTQAILFYVLSMTTRDVNQFLLCFSLVMFIDSIWLIVLLRIGEVKTKLGIQWLISNIILIIAFITLRQVSSSGHVTNITISSLAALIAVVAAFCDYSFNKLEYFPA